MTNLSTFSGSGGKIIFFHGASDPWFSPLDTLGYYQSLAATDGGADQVSERSRMFLVPGMAHCGGPSLDHFDMLTAIVDWVRERDSAGFSDRHRQSFPGPEPGRSAPIPNTPSSLAMGDSEDAQNFRCQ